MSEVMIAKTTAQPSGRRGLVVTLPAFFAKQKGIEKGDEIEIFSDGETLRYVPKKKERK